MPYTKINSGPNKGKYKSESGKIVTKDQMKAYYATNGFKSKPKRNQRAKTNKKRKSK